MNSDVINAVTETETNEKEAKRKAAIAYLRELAVGGSTLEKFARAMLDLEGISWGNPEKDNY